MITRKEVEAWPALGPMGLSKDRVLPLFQLLELDRRLLDTAWGLLCNVDNGDWLHQREDWRRAANEFSRAYFKRNSPPQGAP